MEWIEALRGTIVGLETAPLIYFIEENPTYLPIVRPFFEAVDRGELRVAASVLTLTEVLVHPLRQGDHKLADQYRRILRHGIRSGASSFLTNDGRLPRLAPLNMLVLDQLISVRP